MTCRAVVSRRESLGRKRVAYAREMTGTLLTLHGLHGVCNEDFRAIDIMGFRFNDFSAFHLD